MAKLRIIFSFKSYIYALRIVRIGPKIRKLFDYWFLAPIFGRHFRNYKINGILLTSIQIYIEIQSYTSKHGLLQLRYMIFLWVQVWVYLTDMQFSEKIFFFLVPPNSGTDHIILKKFSGIEKAQHNYV